MGSVVLYIMEWAFALIVLLTIYKAAFSGTTFYRFNRFYLLGATLLSALLPLVHITIPEKAPVVSEIAIENMDFAQELSGTFILMGEPLTTPAPSVQPERKSSLWAVILVCTYSAYVIMLMTGWVRSIIRTRKFLRGKNRRRISRLVWLVSHDEDFGPFSWMNYIVISDTEKGFARRASLRHEYSHVKLLHSADLVFLLACTILNPVCWLVLQEIKIVHEYEADNEVINRYGIRNSDYQKLLIMRTVGAEAYALASSFNLNIKKRIIMMNKNKTRKRRLMWLLLLIPMLGMTSVLFARTEKSIGPDDLLNLSPSNENDGKEYVENSSYEISGKVVDKDGNPIALAQFAVLPELSGMATLTKCVSDLKGEFAFSAQKGDVVTVSKDGYKSIKINVDKSSSDLTVTLEKTKEQQPKLKSGEIIQGVVIDASHGEAPIMLADVYELDRDERIRAHAITDMEGNFSIRIVDPDDFIKVSNKGYQSALSEIKKDLKIRLVEVKTEPYNYHVLNIGIQTDGLVAQVLEYRHENGKDKPIGETEPSKIQLHQLDEYLNGIGVTKNGIHTAELTLWPNISDERIAEVNRVLKKWSIRSVRYKSPMPTEDDDEPLMEVDEQPAFSGGLKDLILIYKGEYLNGESGLTETRYGVVHARGSHPESYITKPENLESNVKEFFDGKREDVVLHNTEENFNLVKSVLEKYPDKEVIFLAD